MRSYKREKVKGKDIRKMGKLIKKIIGSILQLLFSFFPIKKNKILFETGTGEIKDNTKAV